MRSLVAACLKLFQALPLSECRCCEPATFFDHFENSLVQLRHFLPLLPQKVLVAKTQDVASCAYLLVSRRMSIRLNTMPTGLEALYRFYHASKCVIRNLLSILFASGAVLAGSVATASAQTTPVPLVFSTVIGGGSGSTTLTGLPTTTTSSATLDLDFFGDLNSFNETLAVSLDGVLVGTLGGAVIPHF